MLIFLDISYTYFQNYSKTTLVSSQPPSFSKANYLHELALISTFAVFQHKKIQSLINIKKPTELYYRNFKTLIITSDVDNIDFVKFNRLSRSYIGFSREKKFIGK